MTVDAVDAALEEMAARVRITLPSNSTSHETLNALRRYLYEPGPWNDNATFSYDLDDPYAKQPSSRLIATYLRTRRGNCVTMPMLFVAVGQKLGLDVTLSQAPEHYFVKYRDNAGSEFNLETTSGAGLTSDSWIIQNTHATPESIKSGIYLRRLSRRETLIAMLNELMRSMVVDNNEAAAIDLANLCLQYWSNDFSAMLILHFAYGHAAKREFQDRYAWPEDIPRDLYPRYKELARDSQFWRMRAEALGWQEPTDKKEEEYLRSINEATTDSKLRGQP